MAKKKEEVEVKNKKNSTTTKREDSKKVQEKKETKNSTTTKRVDSKKVQEKKETKNSNVSKKVEKIKKESNVISNEKKVINDLNNVSDSKNKKTLKIIIYSLISIVILGTLIYSIIESNERGKYFNSITFNNVDTLMNNEEKSIIYWAQPNCGYCTQFTPVVKKVSFDKKVTFNYLNTANLTQDEYASMITYLSSYNEEYASGLGTPSLILVENGKIIDVSVGALSEDGLVSYLSNNKLIEPSKYFKTVSFNDVNELIKEDEVSIIYWAQPSCGFCTQFTPIVQKVADDNKITFNYLNTSELSKDEYDNMLKYLGKYKEDYSSGIGTPSIIIFKGGKVIDVLIGALSEDDLVNYLSIKELIK